MCNTDVISAWEVAGIVATEYPYGTPEVMSSGESSCGLGDVPHPQPARLQRARGHGWRPAGDSGQAVTATARALLAGLSAPAHDRD